MRHLAGAFVGLIVVVGAYWFVYYCLSGGVVTR